jgi:hypothetical protein
MDTRNGSAFIDSATEDVISLSRTERLKLSLSQACLHCRLTEIADGPA